MIVTPFPSPAARRRIYEALVVELGDRPLVAMSVENHGCSQIDQVDAIAARFEFPKPIFYNVKAAA